MTTAATTRPPTHLPARTAPEPQRRSGSIARLRLLGALAAACAAAPALALDWRADLSAGMLTTDNLLRTDGQEEDATVQTAATEFLIRNNSSKLNFDAVGNMTYRKYDIDGVDDDFLPTLDTMLQWTISPERFAWTLTDNLGQFAVNPNDGLVPPDRENLNVVSTGPDLQFNLGGSTYLTAAGRYSRVNYEDSPFDSDRLAGRVGFERELESARFVSVNFSQAHTEFKQVSRSFDIQSLFLGYTASGSKASLDANVGATRLDDDDASSSTGFFADVRLQRQMSRHTALGADIVHRIADSSDVFRRSQDLQPEVDTTVDIIATDQAVRESSVDINYSWRGRRSYAMFGALYFHHRFLGDGGAENRSGTGLHLNGEIELRPTLTLESRIQWQREAPELESTIHLTQGSVNLNWQFARTLGLALGVEQYRRSGGSSNNYDETRMQLRLNWQVRQLSRPSVDTWNDTPARRRLNNPREGV